MIGYCLSDPRIMKILMGLLGYSCKIHRKRSRLSFSEDRSNASSSKEPISTSKDNNELKNNGRETASISGLEDGKCDNKNKEEIFGSRNRKYGTIVI